MHIWIIFKNHVKKYVNMNWCLSCVFSPESCDVNFIMYGNWPICRVFISGIVEDTWNPNWNLLIDYSSVGSNFIIFFLNFEYIKRLNLTYLLRISWQRARATNGKYGPVDLSKNENDWKGLWIYKKVELNISVKDFMAKS